MSDFVIPDGPHAIEAREPRSVSSVEACCDAIVARLKERLTGGVLVEHFPDQPEQFDFSGYGAAALVLYGGSKFANAGMRGAQGAIETLLVHVVLLVAHLRPSRDNPAAAYAILQDIRQALHGHSFAGSTGLRPVAVDLERHSDDGVYQYRSDFECELPAIPGRQPGVMLPRGFQTDRR